MSVKVVKEPFFDYVRNELALLKVNSIKTSSEGSRRSFSDEEFPALGTESSVYLPTAAKGCKSPDLVPLTKSTKTETESSEYLLYPAKDMASADDFELVLSKTEMRKRKKQEAIERKKNVEAHKKDIMNRVRINRDVMNGEITNTENEKHIYRDRSLH